MSASMPLEPIKALVEKSFPFVERCGVQLLEASEGCCKMLMPLEPNRNHIGTMYAGALFTLAELPGGVVYITSFDTSRFYPIVKNLDLRFRRPAATDIIVSAELSQAESIRVQKQAEEIGKCDYQWTLELKDTSGEVVAIAETTYQLRKIGS